MHWDIVPAEMQPARSKRAIRFDPVLENEIQVPFCDLPVLVIEKDLGSTVEQESPVSGRIDHSPFIVRGVRATASGFGCPEILDIIGRMSRDRGDDSPVIIELRVES